LPPILKQKGSSSRQDSTPVLSPQPEGKFPKLNQELLQKNKPLLPKIDEEGLTAGEADMQSFVQSYYQGLNTGKPHTMELALKKMRLHHRVLSQVSFNAYKVMTQAAELITLRQG